MAWEKAEGAKSECSGPLTGLPVETQNNKHRIETDLQRLTGDEVVATKFIILA